METEIISSLSAFQNMRAEWNELAARFPSPLLRHEWLTACIETLYPKGAVPAIFVVRSGGKLRAAAPLISVRRALLPELETLGADAPREPFGFIYDSEAALTTLLGAILDKRRSFLFARLGRTTRETQLLQDALSKGCVRVERDGASSLRVPLAPTWAAFEASLSSGRRSDLRRYRRRAESLGEVAFEVVHPDAQNLADPMETLLRIEASGWKGQNGSAILSLPHIRAFYERYARAAAEQGMLRFFFLKIDGKTVAARLAVEHGNRLWDLRMGYDESLSRCAPGVLLTHETLRYAVERGLEAYEFLGRAEAWERHWPCEEDHYVSLRVYPFSVKGQLSFVQDGCRLVSTKTSDVVQSGFNRVMRRALALPGATIYAEEGLALLNGPAGMTLSFA
jgi:CelD/BcsL family acetyltransferase involved in cellulose biosynthesis